MRIGLCLVMAHASGRRSYQVNCGLQTIRYAFTLSEADLNTINGCLCAPALNVDKGRKIDGRRMMLMFSTAESLDLGLLSCNIPVIQDSVPTYEDFLVGLSADDFPGDATDIFGSWRYDLYLDGASLSLELGQYMEVFSPYDSVLATHFSGDFATALSGILVMDPSVDIFNSFESFHSFGECTFLFCDTSMRTRLDISDIADVTPPIVSCFSHGQPSARASGRNDPVGLFLEVND